MYFIPYANENKEIAIIKEFKQKPIMIDTTMMINMTPCKINSNDCFSAIVNIWERGLTTNCKKKGKVII